MERGYGVPEGRSLGDESPKTPKKSFFLRPSLPRYIARLLLYGNRFLAGVPGREGLHLGERGGVPHPLDRLPVGDDVHVLHLHLKDGTDRDLSDYTKR